MEIPDQMLSLREPGGRTASPHNEDDSDLGRMKALKARNAIGLAVAMTLVSAARPARAAGSVCTETKSTSVDHKGNDGSECYASSDGMAKAHSSASGSGSYAEADAATHGKSTATATGGSESFAQSDTNGHSTSHAMNGGNGDAESDEHGIAKSTSTGADSHADSHAFGKCKATATVTGSSMAGGSMAFADCESNGTFVNATANGGGVAMGSDSGPPSCDVSGGGTATVHSTGGNCSK